MPPIPKYILMLYLYQTSDNSYVLPHVPIHKSKDFKNFMFISLQTVNTCVKLSLTALMSRHRFLLLTSFFICG